MKRWNYFQPTWQLRKKRVVPREVDPGEKYWEYYRTRARDVALIASYEARQDETIISTGYLLLGLLRGADSDCLSLLQQHEVAVDSLCSYVEEHVIDVREPRWAHENNKTHWISEEGSWVLKTAWQEARLLGCSTVDTPHLLWGLVAEESTWAAQLLMEHGVRQEHVRAFLLRLYGQSLLVSCLPPASDNFLLRAPANAQPFDNELLRADSPPFESGL